MMPSTLSKLVLEILPLCGTQTWILGPGVNALYEWFHPIHIMNKINPF